jgi:hypothetical protein
VVFAPINDAFYPPQPPADPVPLDGMAGWLIIGYFVYALMPAKAWI